MMRLETGIMAREGSRGLVCSGCVVGRWFALLFSVVSPVSFVVRIRMEYGMRVLLLVCLLALLVSSLGLGRSLYVDEAFSLHFAGQPSALEVVREDLYDSNPPLYYLILHFLPSLAWMKALGVGLVIVLVVLTFKVTSELYGEFTAVLASGLVAVNPLIILYGQLLRPYLLLADLLMLAFLAGLTERRWLFILASVLVLWVSNYAVLFIIVLAWYLRLYRELLLVLLLGVPAFYYAAVQAGSFGVNVGHGLSWFVLIIPYLAVTFLSGVAYVVGDKLVLSVESLLVVGFLLSSFAVIIFLGRFRRLLLLAALPPLFFIGLNVFGIIMPVHAHRFLLSGVVLLILAAVGLTRLFRINRTVAVGFALAVMLCFLRADFALAAYQFEDWRGAADYLKANVSVGDVVLLSHPQGEYALRYYYNGSFKVFPQSINWSDANWRGGLEFKGCRGLPDANRLWYAENRADARVLDCLKVKYSVTVVEELKEIRIYQLVGGGDGV